MSRYCMEWFHFWLRDLNINRKFDFFKNTVVPYVSINVISRYNSTLIWIFWQPIMTIYHVPLYRIGWLYYKGFSRNLSRTGHEIKQSIYNTVTLPNKYMARKFFMNFLIGNDAWIKIVRKKNYSTIFGLCFYVRLSNKC